MIAVLGGTFDPPHQGHVFLAEAARRRLGADRVHWMPAWAPPHKNGPQAPAYHRFAMTALCCADSPAWIPDARELERGEREGRPSYTQDTLEEMHERNLGPVVWILGADMLEDFPNWREPERILELAALAAFPRGGRDPEAVVEDLPDWLAGRVVRDVAPGGLKPGRIGLIGDRPPEVSSSRIRECVRGGREIGDLVLPSIADYIEKTGLYRS